MKSLVHSAMNVGLCASASRVPVQITNTVYCDSISMSGVRLYKRDEVG